MKEIARIVEQLCESLVLADVDRTDRLTQVAVQFREVGAWAAKHKQPQVAVGARAAAGLVERLMRGDVPDRALALDVAGQAASVLQSIVSERRNPNETPFPDALFQEPSAPAQAPAAQAGSFPMVEPDLLDAFVSEAHDHIEAAEAHLLALETSPTSQEDIHAVFRAFHTIKGAAAFLNFDDIRALSHEMEGILDKARAGELFLGEDVIDVALAATDSLKRQISQLGSSAAGKPPIPDTNLPHVLERIRAVTAGSLPAAELPAPEAPAKAEGAAPAVIAAAVRDTVKVDSERLDRLLDTIGELVIAQSMLTQSSELLTFASPDLERLAREVDKITRSLQQMSTSLRMVPIRPVFHRMARLVRDLSRKAGKSIDLQTSGEDTEIDKAVVDRMGDPLVHLLRNAVDHGIEAGAAERAAAGKPPAARIQLRAFHRGGNICIEVEDDGRGLDAGRILSRAREAGLVPEGTVPTEKELFDFIFLPGFSTASRVTDVSGRGVGMDVVKRVVEGLRGQVDVSSAPGRGCTISIRLPLTLAIIDGMVLRVGEERYIVPTLSIIRSLRPASEDLSTVAERGEMLSVEGRLIPLFRLCRLFDIPNALTDPTQAITVVVGDNGNQVGLMVDELLGQQQIVIKGIGDYMRGVLGIAGGAIMPDGAVGLIVDVTSLLRLTQVGDKS